MSFRRLMAEDPVVEVVLIDAGILYFEATLDIAALNSSSGD